jgi:hypothetical protein
MNLRLHRFSDPGAYVIGLAALRRSGVTPRGLLFLALEPGGAVHLAVPEDVDEVTRIRVGDKMACAWPLEGRFYHFDCIHRLRDGRYTFNGDRRLKDPGNAVEVAGLTGEFLKAAGARDVFFGCNRHQPGSWLVVERRANALHEAGFVGVVPFRNVLLARRVMDHRLWQLETSGERLDDWQPLWESPLGNLVYVERRIINDRLVLTCERGLVEVDLASLPTVTERARVPMQTGFAVVGRVENTAFAVTQGKLEPWGIDAPRPAVIIGAPGGSLASLGVALAEAAARREPASS